MSRVFKGKSWIAPPLLFKAEKALYFPNFMGRTLAPDSEVRMNTTSVLRGRISIVAVYSSLWAERQVRTFLDGTQLPEGAQRVDINIEQNFLKSFLIKMFLPRMRKQLPKDSWGHYFVISKGVTRDLQRDLGLWNSKVGYVFVVDKLCRIRWAGSGNAVSEEKVTMVRGLERLVNE